MKRVAIISILLSAILVGCGKKEDAKIIVDSSAVSGNEQTDVNDDNSYEDIVEKREDADFRNTKWGDSVEDVKKHETASLAGEDETSDYKILVYKDTVVGYNVAITYLFYDGKLRQAGYQVENKYVGTGQYISAYEDLKSKLESLYGNPKTDSIDDYSGGLLDSTSSPSEALMLGFVEYDTQWINDNTKIDMDMYSEANETYIIIKYWDKNFETDYSDSGL